MEERRFYRKWVTCDDLVTFEVKVQETDLLVSCEEFLDRLAVESVIKYRKDIEDYIREEEAFRTSLVPIDTKKDKRLSPIVKSMMAASQKARVGPMAAVAGAIAEFVGRDILQFSKEVIIENGGDIFLRTFKRRRFGLFAGESPFSGNLTFELEPDENGLGVCTSSGTIGHSLSFGKADAALIVSHDAALADALATAMGNMAAGESDMEKAIEFARSIQGVKAALIIVGGKMASWGEIKLGTVPA